MWTCLKTYNKGNKRQRQKKTMRDSILYMSSLFSLKEVKPIISFLLSFDDVFVVQFISHFSYFKLYCTQRSQQDDAHTI